MLTYSDYVRAHVFAGLSAHGRTLARDLPVTFHVNASPNQIAALYWDAAIYCYGTGLGAALATEPYAAEHFRVAVVEAMSAGCVPLALNAGGPREIVTVGVDDLVDRTAILLPEMCAAHVGMGLVAQRRATESAPDLFRCQIRALVFETSEVQALRQPGQLTLAFAADEMVTPGCVTGIVEKTIGHGTGPGRASVPGPA